MFIQTGRLGQDATVTQMQNGKTVTKFSMAYEIGFGNNKKSQWIYCSMWGERGVSVSQFLKKGTKILLTATDLEVFVSTQGNASLQCKATDIELLGRPQSQQQPQQPQQPQEYQPQYQHQSQDDYPI